MDGWTNPQRAFAVKAYYETRSYAAAQRRFRTQFAIHRNRPVPTPHAIKLWVANFEATASTNRRRGGGRRTARTPENIERVRVAVGRSPLRSARRHSVALQLCDRTVRRVLKLDLHNHPYKLYDSNPSPTDSENSDEFQNEKKKEKEKPVKKTKTVSEKPRKRRGTKKKDKHDNKPKRPPTAFMLWLIEHREKIKSDNPGISVTEIAKRAGELWKEMKDKSTWEGKASKAKEEYQRAMKEYNESGGAATTCASGDSRKETKKKPAAKPSPVKSTGAYKSKEYISEDDSSSGEDKQKKKKKPLTKVAKKERESVSDSGSDNKKPASKKMKADDANKDEDSDEDDDDFEEPEESTPSTTEDDDDDDDSGSD